MKKTLSLSVFLACALVSSSALGQSLSPSEVAKKVFPSTLLIVCYDSDGQQISLGSGFVFGETSDGDGAMVVTNYHVIEGAATVKVKVVNEESVYDANRVESYNAELDVAFIRVPGLNAPAVRFMGLGDMEEAVVIGEQVYAIGNPSGLEGSFSDGIISGIREAGSFSLIQITAPISAGSSGGPVANRFGSVIGMAVATFRDGQNLNFAIPVKDVLASYSPNNSMSFNEFQEETKDSRSLHDEIDGESLEEAVKVYSFRWTSSAQIGVGGSFSISVKNRLNKTISNLKILVSVEDKRNGQPIDFTEITFYGKIPPGLGKRIGGEFNNSTVAATTQKTTGLQFEGRPAYFVDRPKRDPKFKVVSFEVEN